MFGWIRRMVGELRREPPVVNSADHYSDDERRLTEDEWWHEPVGPPPPTVGEVFGDELRRDRQPLSPPTLPPGLLPPGNEERRRERIAEAMERDAAAKYMRRTPHQ